MRPATVGPHDGTSVTGRAASAALPARLPAMSPGGKARPWRGSVRSRVKTRRRRLLVLSVAVALGTTRASGQLPQPEPLSPRPRFSITAEDRFAWSCYMICFPVGRDYTGLSYDRPLDRPADDGTNPRLIDLRNAVDAGFDALSVDLFILDKYALPAFRQLVDLVKTHDLPIGLSPFFDGFGNPALTEGHVVEKVKAWFGRFAAEPCVVRTNGKPVIFTFGPPSLDADAWQRILARLRDAGCDGHWILDGGGPLCLGERPRFEAVAPWIELFDGAYTFAPGKVPDRPVLNARLYHERHSGSGRFWTGSTKIGYWRPEIAVYTSPEGTSHFRRSWDALDQASITWVQQATWNDFSENHALLPSANAGTTFAELNRFLVRTWKGLPSEITHPRLFLGRMREAQVGEEAVYELLAMLPDDTASAAFELDLLDSAGALLHRCPARTLSVRGLAAPHFTFPVTSVPAGRLLVPRATLRTPQRQPIVIHGEPSIVSPAGFRPERCYSWIYTPGHRQLANVDIRFSLDGTPVGASASVGASAGQLSVEVTSPVPMVDVEVLRSGLPVLVLRRHVRDGLPATHVTHEASLERNRRGRLDWGFYQVRVTTADRRVAVSRPIFVDPTPDSEDLIGFWPFDQGDDYRVLDASPWMRDGRLGARTHYPQHQPKRVPDPWGGNCVRFDGVDDRLQMDGPVVPQRRFTVECWVRPESWGWPGRKDASAIVFASANADCVVAIGPKGTLVLSRKGDSGWVRVDGLTPLPLNEWTHVAVTFDGTTIMLLRDGVEAGSVHSPGARRISRCGIGFNTVTLGSFFHGCIDDVRIHERVLTPLELGPHCPLREADGTGP